jgi:hypothetical protein
MMGRHHRPGPRHRRTSIRQRGYIPSIILIAALVTGFALIIVRAAIT